MQENETKPNETSANQRTPRRRTSRKRTVFHTTPKPAWPVRGLWEAALPEERAEAHATCMLILEYWLGKKSKSEVAAELEVSALRVWQLSQQALSGMMAGLLTQPRRKVTRDAFEEGRGETKESLRKRIAKLEQELSRTEDLVRVLRTAPWANPVSDSPPKGGKGRGPKGKQKVRPKGGPLADRSDAPNPKAHEEGASGGG